MSSKRQTNLNRHLLEININSEADESVFNEIFSERGYRILDDLILNARSPIIDIGAHTGMFSIYCSCFNPKMQIFAYEPDSENYAAMKENLKLNNVRNVFIKNVAVAARTGERILYVSRDSHNHSIVNAESAGDFSGEEKKVQAISLERIFEQNRLASASLVKIDCEGAEFEILENLPGAIFAAVENFYVEYHEYSYGMKPVRLREIFQKNGFNVLMNISFYDQKMGFILAVKS